MLDEISELAIDFYKDKAAKPEWTDKFIKEYQQEESDGYISLARAFEAYNKINSEMEKSPDIRVHALRDLDKDFVLNVKCNKDDGEPNQKWHFLVAFCAMVELEGSEKEKSLFSKSYPCPELRLWLIEAAKDGNIIKEEDVKAAYNAAKDYKNGKINKVAWNNLWLDSSNAYNAYEKKIEAVISKANS